MERQVDRMSDIFFFYLISTSAMSLPRRLACSLDNHAEVRTGKGGDGRLREFVGKQQTLCVELRAGKGSLVGLDPSSSGLFFFLFKRAGE